MTEPRRPSDVRPPTLADRLLGLGLPRGERGRTIRGDLREEFAARVAAGSVRDARRWYRRQAWSIAIHYLVHARRSSLMDTLRHDLRFAIRTLLKARGFTIAVLATLAVGIGATTAIFSVVNAVVIRPLPFPDADRLMFLSEYSRAGDGQQRRQISIAWPNFVDWRDRLSSFEQLAASRVAIYPVLDPERPDRINGRHVTWNFFRAFGVSPARGRDFTPEDERPGAPPVIIIRHEFWQRQYGGAPDILGREIRLGNQVRTIVGVLPPDFGFARTADVFEPFGFYLQAGSSLLDRGNHNGLGGVGRLKRDVSETVARQELIALSAQLEKDHPNTNSSITADLEPLSTRIVGDTKPLLWTLFAAVGCLLLIGCVNVANLLIARGVTRRHEIAVRMAMGCSRLRLVRQLLVESAVLSLAGAALGVAAAVAAIRGLLALMPDMPRIDEVRLDATAIWFALAAAIVCGFSFGLLPALHTAGKKSEQGLVRAGRGGSSATSRLRHGLMAAEVALALILLTGAGLTFRTMQALGSVDAGFNPTGVLTARVTAAGQGWDNARLRTFGSDVLAALRGVPGVTHAALALSLPVEGSQWGSVFIVGDKPVPPRPELPSAAFSPVSDGYFEALQVRMVAGRSFLAQDDASAPRVAIVNETAARRLWPGEDPLGKRIKQGWPEWDTPWWEVVGVAADIKLNGVDVDTPMQIYLPFAQNPTPNPALIARTAGEAAALKRPVEDAVHRLVASMPVYANRTLVDLMDGALIRQRASMSIFSAFAVIAVALACIGLYGVVAHGVSQRTHEVGVRMALGARRLDVLSLFVRRGVVSTLVGLIIGAASALLLSRLIQDQLFGVAPNDQATLWTVAAVLFVVSVTACYLPARRATRIDPTEALRER